MPWFSVPAYFNSESIRSSPRKSKALIRLNAANMMCDGKLDFTRLPADLLPPIVDAIVKSTLEDYFPILEGYEEMHQRMYVLQEMEPLHRRLFGLLGMRLVCRKSFPRNSKHQV